MDDRTYKNEEEEEVNKRKVNPLNIPNTTLFFKKNISMK